MALALLEYQVEPEQELEEVDKAVEVAINSRFSLVAIGTTG